MLILTRRVGETLMIGDGVTVTVLGVDNPGPSAVNGRSLTSR
jgi:carbon storage regulator CsrA